jgi:hypothetical protein
LPFTSPGTATYSLHPLHHEQRVISCAANQLSIITNS